MKAQIRLGFFIFRSREPAFRYIFCSSFLITKGCRCNQGWALRLRQMFLSKFNKRFLNH